MTAIVARMPSYPAAGVKRAIPRVLALYALSRLVTTVFLFAVLPFAAQGDCGSRCAPDLRFFSGGWDATYYRHIAVQGYPASLPIGPDGEVKANEWAFLPVYPLVVRVVSLTGLNVDLAGIMVSAVAGAFAAIGLYLLLRVDGSDRSALWAVALFCFGPLSFVLQAEYAESLFLALAFFALHAIRRERWSLACGLGIVAAFTRPGALAIALTLGIVLVMRSVRARGRARLSRRSTVAVVVSGLLIAAAGLCWPMIAGAVTGVPDAYLRTEMAWWAGFIGRVDFLPLTPWFLFWGRYLGLLGWLAVLVVAGLFAWWIVGSRRRMLAAGADPLVLVSWAASYGLYLLAVFLPQQSLPRLLLPLAPMLGDPGLAERRGLRVCLLIVGIAAQPVAIVLLWVLGYP